MAENWSAPRYADDFTPLVPEIPPHAARCLKHEKWVRGPCPYCTHEAMFPEVAASELDHEPVYHQRGRQKNSLRNLERFNIARKLRASGLSINAIGRELGIPASTLQQWLTI